MGIDIRAAPYPQYGTLMFNFAGAFTASQVAIYRLGSSGLTIEASALYCVDVSGTNFWTTSATQFNLSIPCKMWGRTTVQKAAIAAPVVGMVIFDTDLAKLCVWTGAAWETITSI